VVARCRSDRLEILSECQAEHWVVTAPSPSPGQLIFQSIFYFFFLFFFLHGDGRHIVTAICTLVLKLLHWTIELTERRLEDMLSRRTETNTTYWGKKGRRIAVDHAATRSLAASLDVIKLDGVEQGLRSLWGI
jgi:hypothetical protein